MRRLIGLLLLVSATGACGGGGSGLAIGEACSASSQCGEGLVCDFTATPPACALIGGIPPDAPLPDPADAAPAVDGPDAAPEPDAPPGTPDARPPDAARPDARTPDARLPDAALPDAA